MLEQKWTLDVESNQYELTQGQLYLIGSAEADGSGKKKVDIFLKSQTVDAKHCVLDATGTTLCVYDLHSELGTFLNGKRLDSMLKEFICDGAELCIGQVTGHLILRGNKEQRAQHNSSTTEIFIAPTQRAPRSSLSNTSTRLFSSPDVSIVGSTIDDDSFNIPETQHIQQRVSSLMNTSAKQSIVEKSVNDDSFIPETQMVTPVDETVNKNPESLIQQSLQQQTDELIRMCTQDFNENLFSEGVGDETFTSLIIPNVKHPPVILTHGPPVCNNISKNVSKASSCDSEMEALNWSAQTSKGAITDDIEEQTQCLGRDDVCTPDLFDFPELAELNMQGALAYQMNEKPQEIKTIEENVITVEKGATNEITTNVDPPMRDGVVSGDGYAEEIDMMPTQVFIPKPKPNVSHVADAATQVFTPKPKQNQSGLVVANGTNEASELSLSGKENIPQADICLEQTQIFPTTKDANAVDNKCNLATTTATTVHVFDTNLSMLPPTQLFSRNANNSARHSKTTATSEENKTLQNLNSTLVPRADSEKPKSVASFFEDIEDATDKAANITEQTPSFKKPKQSTSSSKSTSSKEKVTCCINYSQTETEDIQCTPRWIVDNFDELTVDDRNVDDVKKRMLFGSDSEDEPDLNTLVTKKDSKDFDRLLANIKDAKPPPIVLESPKTVLVKQEGKIDAIKRSAEKNTKKEPVSKNDDEKQSSKKGNDKLIENKGGSNHGKKITRSTDKGEKTRSTKEKEIAPLVENSDKKDHVNEKTYVGRKQEYPPTVSDSIEKRQNRSTTTSTSNDQKTIQQSIEKHGKPAKEITPTVQKSISSIAKKTSTAVEQESPRLGSDSKDKQRNRSAPKITSTEGHKKIEPPVEKAGKSGKEIIPTSSNAKKASAKKSPEIPRISTDNKDKKGTSKSILNDQKTDVTPAKRVTRLRSRTIDLDADKASGSTLNPSEAKKRRMQTKEEDSETNKKRLTRLRSKTDSQESLASTKSSNSNRSTKRGKSLIEKEEKLKHKDSGSAISDDMSKPAKASEVKDASALKKSDIQRKRKASVDNVSSDDDTKRLRSTTRTLQVAMTMVEPELFQCLLNNSPGNWCIASDPTTADVLVMDKGNRTLKFLIAMAKGIPIVTSNWLESLNSTKTVPRGIAHFFRDKEFESRHKFSLLKSLELARKRKIFEGYDFLTTPSILPQPPEMKQIIECAGGKVHSEAPPLKPNQNVYVISSFKDKKHWHKYRRSNANIRITSSEGIMESVMRQTTTPLDTHIFV